MKKCNWKWLLGLCLIALLSVLPMEETMGFATLEKDYWTPFGDEDFVVELQWLEDCEEVLKRPDYIGEGSYAYLNVTNNYKKGLTINITSSNPKIISIESDSKSYVADSTYGDKEINYRFVGYGVASIIFEVEGRIYEKEILVMPEDVNVTKIEKVDNTSIKITWEKIPGVSGVVIERDDPTDSRSEYETYVTTTGDANSAIVDAKWGERWNYRVVPYVKKGAKKIYAEYLGDSMDFNLKKVVSEITSVKKSGSSSLKISWNKVKGATGYKVYRSDNENYGYKCVYIANANTTSWTQKVKKGQPYYYRVETIYPDAKGYSQSVSQMIPKYSAAKVTKISGIKKLYTDNVNSDRSDPDPLYYYVADGKLHIIAIGLDEYDITDFTLNSKGKVVAKKRVNDDLYQVATVLRANDGKFYVIKNAVYSGDFRKNKDQVMIKVIQYSSKWKKLKTVKLTAYELGKELDASVDIYNLDCTNFSCDMRDNELHITITQNYTVNKFNICDKVLEFKVNCNSMKIEEVTSDSRSSLSPTGLALKDDGLYFLEPTRYGVYVSGVEDEYDDDSSRWNISAIPKEGESVGAWVGGMEVGKKNVLVCGSARIENKTKNNCKEIYISVIDKATGKTTSKWLTSYYKKKENFDTGAIRMVKLSEDRYAILFSVESKDRPNKETLEYIVVNNEGKKIYSTSYTDIRFTGASQPILYNGNIVWFEGNWRVKNAKTYDDELLCQIPAIYDEDSIVGKTFTYKKQTYKITGKSTVAYTGTKDKKATKIEIPATVTYDRQNFKVTSIADNALAKNKKVKTVVLGTNVKEIGKSAFSGCKKLSTIEVKSKSLKKIGKNALKGISSKLTVKVPKAKLSSYKKLFKGKGKSGNMKWKKL